MKIKDNERSLFIVNVIILVAFLPFLFIQDKDSLFKAYGLMVGFTCGMQVEKTYIHFTMDVALWKKALRVILGLVLMVVIMVGLGSIFDSFAEEGTMLLNVLDLIRYGLIAFVGLGCYPFLFKRFNF
jgi:glucose uptake protein GlcU